MCTAGHWAATLSWLKQFRHTDRCYPSIPPGMSLLAGVHATVLFHPQTWDFISQQEQSRVTPAWIYWLAQTSTGSHLSYTMILWSHGLLSCHSHVTVTNIMAHLIIKTKSWRGRLSRENRIKLLASKINMLRQDLRIHQDSCFTLTILVYESELRPFDV